MGNCGEAGEIHLLFAHCLEWRMEVCQRNIFSWEANKVAMLVRGDNQIPAESHTEGAYGTLNRATSFPFESAI